MNKNIKKIYIFSFLFFVIDFIIKIYINNKMSLYQSIIMIKNFFNITLVHNTGAAFSILNNNRLFLIIIGVIAIIFVNFYMRKEKLNEIDVLIYSLLLGGILGNLIDRIIYGYVIDYFSFKIMGYYFPIFNLADILIVISVVLIILNTNWSVYGKNNN